MMCASTVQVAALPGEVVSNTGKQNRKVLAAPVMKASVTLELGEVSGAVPHELESCWDWAVKRTELMPAAKLRIETIPAVTHCGECGQDYSTVPQGRSCPYCGSEETWLIRGDEINIKEIEAI